ncbi:MAG TPA: glycosyltransferase family 4 protein [Gemmataceae bacterium]|jgi:UDP-glucose:(heptosyl)LPS alpha-1,3-glucosyltransferase|nr:glycosyltransferase family 4 protein [Gemmataceae bacterium]
MKIAFCYESVLPARGGCETYISDLARRLSSDHHEVHLYACRWDPESLPPDIQVHLLPEVHGPRFLRPWLFAASCAKALQQNEHQVTIGFDKTWGQDILYPQGGFHSASARNNLLKYGTPFARRVAGLCKKLDLAHWSYMALERRQYRGEDKPLVLVNSEMVREHALTQYRIEPERVRVLPNAIDPDRFAEPDRPRRRIEWRQRWGLQPNDNVGLFVAMNYRLKGLEPLLHAVAKLPAGSSFRLLIAGNPRFQAYESLAKRLGIEERLRFLGPRRDVHNCYFAADFLIHPTFYDPCSLVVLEGLACGLPIVTSRYNGASELLHPPEDGLVIEDPHDHARLADAIGHLLDPATRSACSQAARRAALRWNFAQHYRALLLILNEVAARKRVA